MTPDRPRIRKTLDAVVCSCAFAAWGFLADRLVFAVPFALVSLISVFFPPFVPPSALPRLIRLLSASLSFALLVWFWVNRSQYEQGAVLMWLLELPLFIAPIIVSVLWFDFPSSPAAGARVFVDRVVSSVNPFRAERRLDAPFRVDWPFAFVLSCAAPLCSRHSVLDSSIGVALVLALLFARFLSSRSGYGSSRPFLLSLSLVLSLSFAGFGGWVGMSSGEYIERKLNELAWGRGDSESFSSMSTSIGGEGRVDLSDEVRYRFSWQSQNGDKIPAEPVSRYIPLAYFNQTKNGVDWNTFDLSSEAVYSDSGIFTLSSEKSASPDDTLVISGKLHGNRNPFPLPPSPKLIGALPVAQINRPVLGGAFSHHAKGLAKYSVVHAPSALSLLPPVAADLEIPESLDYLLDEVFMNSGLAFVDKPSVAHIMRFFSGYSYTLDLSDALHGGPRTLHSFLLSDKRGHCEYFASAGALMLRRAGIPARVVSGYMLSEFDESERTWWARGSDAHAWVVYWDDKSSSWRDFDATPAGWESQQRSSFSALSDFFERLSYKFENFDLATVLRSFSVDEGKTPALVSVGLLAFLFLVLRAARRRPNRRGLLGALDQLDASLERRGFPRPLGIPHHEWLVDIGEPSAREISERLIAHVYAGKRDELLAEDVRRLASLLASASKAPRKND